MPVIFYYTTGLSLYVKFDDASNTTVDLEEGTGLNEQRYEASDADIAAAGLEAGTYTAAIMEYIGTAPANNDTLCGSVGEFVFDGSNEVSSNISEIAALLLQIQGDGFLTGTHSLVSVIETLSEIMGDSFNPTTDNLGRLADALGINAEVPPPDAPISPVTSGVSVTEIFNVSTSQIPISYNINTGTSVTGVRPNKSGTLYLSPSKRVSIETSRLIASQIDNYVNDDLIEIYRRVVQV